MSPAPGLFIAGTDTGVGKTMIAAAVVAALRARGVDAAYLKPVGTEAVEVDGRPVNPDAVLVKAMAGLAEPAWRMNPFCLRAPLAPLAAARLEGVELGFEAVVAESRRFVAGHAFSVVEGAGGVMVPLCQGRLMLDLMVELALPVLVVGRAGLGTINHALLTMAALRARGLAVLGFMFSGGEKGAGDDLSVTSNPALTVEFGHAPYLGTLPFLPDPGPAELLAVAQECLAIDRLPAF